MSFSERLPDPPFAAEAGIQSPAAQPEDWFRALDELMFVVEALCPHWPPREPFGVCGSMLL